MSPTPSPEPRWLKPLLLAGCLLVTLGYLVYYAYALRVGPFAR